MRAEKAIYSLLSAATALTAQLGASSNVYAGQAPQGTTFPAVVYLLISGVELPTIDAFAPYGLCKARVSIIALAKTYPEVKDVLEQVRIALNHNRGTYNGVEIISILRDTVGPDMRDDDIQVFSQSIDFQVTYRE